MKPASSQFLRQKLKEAVRSFFAARSYQEVETPIAVVCPGTEVHLQYFQTSWTDYKNNAHALYLRSSPELHMKQLLAAGLPRIFQLATCFRNHGEQSEWHHPEFTMLEWYETGIGYHEFIDQTGALIRHCAAAMQAAIKSQGLVPATIPQPFEKKTVTEAFAVFAGITLIDQDPGLAKKAAVAGVISVNDNDDFETAFFKILIEKIEPAIASREGMILYDYPPSQAALAAVEEGVARRFEYYIGRTELSNGFKELLGEVNNRQRVQAALAARKSHGYPVPEEDEDFYQAMGSGIPVCCGNALGFDRLLAILCGKSDLSDLIPFRTAMPWRRQNADQS